ncbi:MAG: hypothetical protein AB1324_04145, partial [Candidatus Micrarchaeota archaeon]
ADNHLNYTNVPGGFVITLLSSTSNSSGIRIDPFAPARMVGAVAGPRGPAVNAPAGRPGGAPPPDPSAARPDMDLHAYDSAGNHVGVDYSSGEYENSIPGAIASGDLGDDEEWIFVPEGTDVRFELSTKDTEMYLADNPEFVQYAVPQPYSATAIKFDSQGARSEAPFGNGTASEGAGVVLGSPADPTLKYAQKGIPGMGNNCPLAAALLFLACGFALAKQPASG